MLQARRFLPILAFALMVNVGHEYPVAQLGFHLLGLVGVVIVARTNGARTTTRRHAGCHIASHQQMIHHLAVMPGGIHYPSHTCKYVFPDNGTGHCAAMPRERLT